MLSRSQEPLSDCNRSKAADGVLFIQPVELAPAVEAQVGGWQQPTKQIGCCCPPRTTAHKKCVFQGPRARVLAPALCEQPREKGKAQSAGKGPLERWKDNSPLPPACAAGPHAASNHLWVVTRPDWAERIWVGNFKTCSCFCEGERICITHSGLMDFPMLGPDSPFLLTCSNNESLMSGFPSPPLLSAVSIAGQRCWADHSIPSLELMENRWPAAFQVPGWVLPPLTTLESGFIFKYGAITPVEGRVWIWDWQLKTIRWSVEQWDLQIRHFCNWSVLRLSRFKSLD